MSPPPRARAADAAHLAAGVRAGTASAQEACAEALRDAAAAPQIVWELDAERACADAAAVDGAVSGGSAAGLGPLAGVPVVVKDSFNARGLPTSGGLPAPLHVAGADAEAVARLRRAGAIVIGKTAMDELAWSMTGQAPGHAPLENPVAPGHLVGGSSGGSAAAVAAGIVPAALGSDTAGSVRVPAAWCGVAAVKPTPGRVPLSGVLPLAPSLDTIGVLGRSARDCVLMLQALGIGDGTHPGDLGTVRCAVLDEDDTPDWFERAVAPLLAAGWERARSVRALPRVRLGRLLAAEFAEAWPREPRGLSAEVAAGHARGRSIDPADVASDRRALAEAAERAPASLLGDAGLLLLSTVPGPAPALEDGVTVAQAARFTLALGALGWACASLPCGRVAGRPVGLQLAAAPGKDLHLLACMQQAAQLLDAEAELA